MPSACSVASTSGVVSGRALVAAVLRRLRRVAMTVWVPGQVASAVVRAAVSAAEMGSQEAAGVAGGVLAFGIGPSMSGVVSASGRRRRGRWVVRTDLPGLLHAVAGPDVDHTASSVTEPYEVVGGVTPRSLPVVPARTAESRSRRPPDPGPARSTDPARATIRSPRDRRPSPRTTSPRSSSRPSSSGTDVQGPPPRSACSRPCPMAAEDAHQTEESPAQTPKVPRHECP